MCGVETCGHARDGPAKCVKDLPHGAPPPTGTLAQVRLAHHSEQPAHVGPELPKPESNCSFASGERYPVDVNAEREDRTCASLRCLGTYNRVAEIIRRQAIGFLHCSKFPLHGAPPRSVDVSQYLVWGQKCMRLHRSIAP